MMDLTLKLGSIQRVGFPPLTPGLQEGTESGGSLQFDPLPVVLTLVLHQRVILLEVPLLHSPHHLGTVAWVGAGDGGGALWPGGGVDVVAIGAAGDVRPTGGVLLPVHLALHPVARLAGVGEGLGEASQGLTVPDEVVVVVVVGSVHSGVVTVPQHTLQLAGHQAVVPVPQTVGCDVGGGLGALAGLFYQISSVLTLPPRISYDLSSVTILNLISN